MTNDLTLYQRAAIQTVRNRALKLRSTAQREIDAVLERQAIDRSLLEGSITAMGDGARIGLRLPVRSSPSATLTPFRLRRLG
ncbi:MAG: hypothetical protein JO025_12845 [Verrucomicrobia bacterium]|nr:hypothetical protein [Verrucomicrobiota bacterium]